MLGAVTTLALAVFFLYRAAILVDHLDAQNPLTGSSALFVASIVSALTLIVLGMSGPRQLSWPPGDNYPGRWRWGMFGWSA